jgi:plasmid stability protein
MGKTVQIRDIPDKVHRILKARAAQAGMSLSEYLMRELKQSASIPTEEELWERVKNLPPVVSSESSGEMIRAGREERMRHLDETVGRR